MTYLTCDRSLKKENHLRKKISEYMWQPEKGLVTSSRLLLFFIIISIKRLGSIAKKKKIFEGFLINLFQKNIVFPREFLECMVYIFSCLSKLNGNLELVSDAYLFHENFPYKILCQLSNSFFTFQGIK